jgi:DNA primase
MAGLDYRALRAAISMEQTLSLLDFSASYRCGDQLRGCCPIHDPRGAGDRRCFSVHLGRGVFRCFGCGACGNQLDLWRLAHRLPLYEASLDLCRQANLPPPFKAPPAPHHRAEIRNSALLSPRMATESLASSWAPKWPRF